MKASSAGSNSGRGNSLIRSGSSFTTRGAFGDVDGSGAPAAKGRLGLVALAAAAIVLLSLVPSAQAKVVVSGFGTTGVYPTGSLGGQFMGGQFENVKAPDPRGIAVNNSGSGGVTAGTIYVVDSRWHRVQRFSPAGTFERAWGENVAGRDEKQLIKLTNLTGGSFTLGFGAETTGVLSIVPSAAQIQSALSVLPSIGAGNVSVQVSPGASSSGPFTVRFIGALGGTDVPQLTVNNGQQTPTDPTSPDLPAVSASTIENGSGGNGVGFEICTVAANCQDGLATAVLANGGDLNNPQGVAVNQSTGHVYVTEAGNRRVSQYDADGNFIRTWGGDVLGINEIQTLVVDATAGQYKLTFNGETTADIAFSANGISATSVQGRLRALPSIGSTGVAVTGGTNVGGVRTHTITFTGPLSGTDVPQLTTSNGTTPLSGGTASATVTTTRTGSGGSFTGAEVCAVAASCKSGAAGSATGQFGTTIGYPAIDSSGNVWVPDPNNYRIQVFDSSGNFLKMLGGDVITNGAQGTGNLANGSTTVSAMTTTKHLFEVGQTVTAPAGIQAGTTIDGCAPTCPTATSLILSKPATATVSGQTLTVAAGAGNVPTNEVQTITAAPAEAGSKFRLEFNGQGTGAAGTVQHPEVSKTATVNTTTSGAFAVGQVIRSSSIPDGTTITAVSGSTLTLSEFTTGSVTNQSATAYDLPFDSSAATIQAKLEALTAVGAGNVAVAGPDGGPWAVEFKGTRFADTDVPTMLATASSGSLVVTSANAYEVCSVAAECRIGAPGTAFGQFGGPTIVLDFPGSAFDITTVGGPGDLALDSAGGLYVLDPGNRRVQKFDPSFSSASSFGAAALTPFTGSTAPEHLTVSQNGTRLDFSVINTAAANERQIVELDTAGALKDTSLAGAGLDSVNGLAANTATGALYATTASTASLFRVLALNSALPDPALVLNTTTVKTDSTATFSGTVDPKGGLVACKFQYSTDQVTWTDVPVPGCETLSPNGAQAISANATGLVPTTKYFVRLSVSRPMVGNSTKNTNAKAFETDGISPVVTDAGALQISNTSARIAATIDPRNSQTSWVVQYGTTPSLGSSTDPANVGAGTTPLVVSQVVSGLKPNTTYYFRVVASNLSGGDSHSPTKSFTTRSEALPLPDNRAYEMVSPVDKAGGGALSGSYIPTAIAADGQAVQFNTTSLFGDPPGVQTFASATYVSWRTASGWQTKAATPPMCRIALEDPDGTNPGQAQMLSPNLDRVMFTQPESESCALPPLDPAAPLPSANLYRGELFPGAPSYDLLAPAGSFTQSSSSAAGTPFGYSADFNHLVYRSTGNQTPDSPAAGNFTKIYEWDNGTLRLVSKDPAGNPFTTASAMPLKFGSTLFEPAVPNTVSADGSRIFFQNPLPAPGLGCIESNCELYMREGGTTTHHVSASECTSACGSSQPDAFAWATPSGEKAIFTSAAKLTDDNPSVAGKNLYMYTHGPSPASEPHNLTLISRDEEPGDQLNADFQGVLGMSEDGDTVFFAANGQLVSGASIAPGPKLYRWSWNGGSPTIDYLATLASLDASNGNWFSKAQGTGISNPDHRLTPDGKYLLITTALRLDSAADSDATQDLYRWSEAEGWRCVTCQAPGVPSGGDATGPFINAIDGRRITISDDGSRVFFLTPEAMVPQDVNGTAKDVYQWHDGTISLISTGTSTSDVKLLGFSHSGNEVFFYTEQRLVGWDTDEVGDIYSASIDGGFPEPPPGGAVCEGEACRGAGTSPPVNTGAPTAAFEGPGNKAEPASCPKGTRKATVKGEVVCKKKKARKQHKKKMGQRKEQRAGANREAGK